MRTTYEGTEPYIFISYSHKNSPQVLQVIDHLQAQGFRVWFDAGIEAGSEWPEYIATHLSNCACVIAFISPEFADSDNCRRELNFALDLKKPVLSIYITDVQLPVGMRMQLGLSQALYRNNFKDESSFLMSIGNARILAPCLNAQQAKKPHMDQTQPPKAADTPKTEATKSTSGAKTGTSRHMPREYYVNKNPKLFRSISRTTVILELCYIPLCFLASGLLTGNLNWFLSLVAMALIHPLLAGINRRIIRTRSYPLGEGSRDTLSFDPFMTMLLSTLLGIVLSASQVAYTGIWFLQFLISLGMNLIPSIVATFIYFTT